MIKKAKVDYLDVQELASYLCELSDEQKEDSDFDNIVEEKFYEKFEIDFDAFANLIQHLLPLCELAQSPLTKKYYRGFADRENQLWIIKTEAN